MITEASFSIRRMCREIRGVAFLEFALMFPMFLLATFGTLEVANYMLARMKVQRIASMTADMIAQRGASDSRLNEAQIADIMLALDNAAKPLDLRKHGRIIISAALGEDTGTDGTPDVNRLKWQRFTGGLTNISSDLGCRRTSTVATFDRQLSLNEPIFRAEVAFEYESLFGNALSRLALDTNIIKESATFRGRGSVFHDVLAVDGYPVRDNCSTADGL